VARNVRVTQCIDPSTSPLRSYRVAARLAVLAFPRINNLHVVNALNSSTPAASTNVFNDANGTP
jgi:hypothetical protein